MDRKWNKELIIALIYRTKQKPFCLHAIYATIISRKYFEKVFITTSFHQPYFKVDERISKPEYIMINVWMYNHFEWVFSKPLLPKLPRAFFVQKCISNTNKTKSFRLITVLRKAFFISSFVNRNSLEILYVRRKIKLYFLINIFLLILTTK